MPDHERLDLLASGRARLGDRFSAYCTFPDLVIPIASRTVSLHLIHLSTTESIDRMEYYRTLDKSTAKLAQTRIAQSPRVDERQKPMDNVRSDYDEALANVAY